MSTCDKQGVRHNKRHRGVIMNCITQSIYIPGTVQKSRGYTNQAVQLFFPPRFSASWAVHSPSPISRVQCFRIPSPRQLPCSNPTNISHLRQHKAGPQQTVRNPPPVRKTITRRTITPHPFPLPRHVPHIRPNDSPEILPSIIRDFVSSPSEMHRFMRIELPDKPVASLWRQMKNEKEKTRPRDSPRPTEETFLLCTPWDRLRWRENYEERKKPRRGPLTTFLKNILNFV